MYSRLLWEPAAGNSLLHRADPETKLVLLLVLSVSAVLVDSPRTLYLLFIITLVGHLVAKISRQRWVLLITVLLFSFWGAMVSQAMFYSQEPRSPLICLFSATTPILGPLTGGVFLYREGLAYGAVQALRSSIMLTYGLLLCWTTDPRELLRTFVYLKLPYEIAFMAVTSLRFLPVVSSEAATVMTAQRLRGFKPSKGGSPIRIIRTGFQTLWPVLARALRRAATLALSVESRGFGRSRNRSTDCPTKPSPEHWLRWLIMTSLFSAIVAKVLYSLQFNGLFYHSKLRILYEFVKNWL